MEFYQKQLGETSIAGKLYRRGFTTGTAATAAAKACAIMTTTNEMPDVVEVSTANGTHLKILVEECFKEGEFFCAKVKKFAGDDIDATKDALIGARLGLRDDGKLRITGGTGVGRVTKKGLHQEIGEAAINPGPMKRIKAEALEVLGSKGANIEISVDGGAEIAQKTFNPRIGIEGGISILGTTGIVEPMSEEGFKKSLVAELLVKQKETMAFTPGNYGEKFLNKQGISSDKIVIMSNFVGYMLRESVSRGTKKILVAGHLGKLIKLAGGIFHTHSHVADAKNEIIVSQLALEAAPLELINLVMNANTTEEALTHVDGFEMDMIWDKLADRAKEKCQLHVYGEAEIEVVFFNMEGRFVGMSRGSKNMIKELKG